MASRFKTRVSFGAFANIRTQLQHNISTNAMYSSMRRLLLILNNNFAYIVNTWNFFVSNNYQTDYKLFTSTKNETSDTSDIVYKGDNSAQSESIKSIQWYLDKIDLLNRRLDNIEKILAAAGAKPKFVPAEIGFYLKDNKTTLYSGTDVLLNTTTQIWNPVFHRWEKSSLYVAINYNVTPRNYTSTYDDTTHLCSTQLYRLGSDKLPKMQGASFDYKYDRRCGIYGYGYKIPTGKYFSNDIQIFEGVQLEFEFPITTQLHRCRWSIYQAGGQLDTLAGTVTLVMVISGRHNGVFDGSYTELKNGVTL